MTYLILPGPRPQPWALVAAAYARLAADAAFVRMLAGGAVYQDAFPDDPMPENAPWANVRVSVPVNPFGEVASVIGRRGVALRIVVRSSPARAGYDPRRHHSAIHEAAYGLLNMWTPALDVGAMAYPLIAETVPGDPEYLDEERCLQSGASFRGVIDPSEPA